MTKIISKANGGGNLIAHWTRKPSAREIRKYVYIANYAVRVSGLDATVRALPIEEDSDAWSLGHNTLSVEIVLRHPVKAFRSRMNSSTIAGLTKIVVKFARKAGLFSFDEAMERNKQEQSAFDTLPLEKAYTAIDDMKWDGDIYDFFAHTDGKVRGYRCRHWSTYEGRRGEHFDYGDMKEIQGALTRFLIDIADEMGYSTSGMMVA